MFNKKIASELAIGTIVLIAIAMGGIFWWQNKNSNQQPVISDQQAVTNNQKQTQIANPASVYCEQNGGKLEIRTGPDGSQTGYCKFDDGSECEEWAYFRKECSAENSNIMSVDISSWKTYADRKLGIEFKYPEDWFRRGDEKNTPDWVVTLYKKSTTQTYPSSDFPLDALISVSTIDNPKNLSLQQIFNNDYEACLEIEKRDGPGMGCPGAIDTSNWKSINIDGKPAIRSGITVFPESLPSDNIYIKIPGKFITIDAIYYNEKDYSANLSSIFNKLITTIKITN